jgi:hypothetical protein
MSELAPFAGRWMLISDAAEIRTAVFTDEGALTYFVNLGDRELVMRLQYRVEGAIIVTTQEGAVEEIRTSFTFADPDTLVLEHSGEKFTYRRVLA